MQLTIRDLEILRFINGFGFCEMSHLNNHFNLRVPRCYQLISRLINANLIKAEKVFFRQERILSLTPKGAKHTNLPAMNQLSLSRYKHTIQVINVYLKLARIYPEATWQGEREILREGTGVGSRKNRHTPDAFLLFPNGKKIPIEVELSAKAHARWIQIANTYSLSFDVNEVWYFCCRSIVGSFFKTVETRKFIKVFCLQDFLSDYAGHG